MAKEKKLDNIRDLITNGKVDEAFEELKNLSKEIDDKQLRNSILLNCFSYNKNYTAELLNLQNDTTGINRAVLKILEFIDEIEEQLNNAEELPVKIEKKIDLIIERHFGDVIIDRGDLYKSLSQTAITLKQFEAALKEVKKHLEFFKKEFKNSGGMTLDNLAAYAIDAIFVPRDEWHGSRNRMKITREFRELINEGK
jgi:ribosomal protein L22